jgi:hypothetical protein
MTQKTNPVKVVMVRRGSVTIPSVPTQKLRTFIRKRALLGSDEISGDGKSWVRADSHYQLSKFFTAEDGENNSASQSGDTDLKFSESPPNVENNLQEVLDLLKDINGL